MHAKYTFNLTSDDPFRPFPNKIIIGQAHTETVTHVGLKLLGYLLFFRERLQLETRLPDDNFPYVPDLAQLDYTLRPQLWVECGECSIAKLQKLAVKAPEADIWVLKKSLPAADELVKTMAKAEFRKGRYHVIGLDHDIFQELTSLILTRNDLYWLKGPLDSDEMHFDLNGLWFELPFRVQHY